MLQGIIAGPAASASGSLGTKGALLGKGFLAAQSATRQATAQFPQRSSQSRLALQAAVASEVDARNFTPNSRRPQAAPEHLQVGAVMQNLACAAHVPEALPVAVHVIWRELGGWLWLCVVGMVRGLRNRGCLHPRTSLALRSWAASPRAAEPWGAAQLAGSAPHPPGAALPAGARERP